MCFLCWNVKKCFAMLCSIAERGKNMRYFKKIVAFVLVLISVFVVANTALAYTETPVSGTRYITSANGNPVNVRTGPGTSYALASVGKFSVGTQVTLQAQAKGTDGNTWYKVVNSSNKGGWVRQDFLTTSSGGTGGQEDWEIRYGTGNLSTAGGSSTRQQILNFQKDLQSLGYELGAGGVDGYYGTDTKNAVKQFQRDNNLDSDGIAGPATKKKLYSLTH